MSPFRTFLLMTAAVAAPLASAAVAAGDAGTMVRASAVAEMRRLHGPDALLDFAGSAPRIACRADGVELMAIEPLSLPVAGRVAAMATLRCSDGRLQSLPLWFSLHLPQTAWIARRDLPSGESLQPADFEQKKLMLPAGSGIVEAFPDGSRELLRPLQAGARLHENHTRLIPAVRAGRPVTAHLKQQRVELRLDAIALGNGDAGSLVRVRRAHGQGSLWARVTGKDTVELQP